MKWDEENLVNILKENGVVVMPTDTLYGIVGRAEEQSVVERIYSARKRNPEKPCIVLIGEVGELKKFGIFLTEGEQEKVEQYSEPTSFILDCLDEKLSYLHRGTQTLAFRIPSPLALRDLLIKTGPLVAPSANPEGLLPAQNIKEAKKYFGDLVDIYIDAGEIIGKPSKVIRLHKDGTETVLRD